MLDLNCSEQSINEKRAKKKDKKTININRNRKATNAKRRARECYYYRDRIVV